MHTQKHPRLGQAALCFGGVFLILALGITLFEINLHLLLICALVWVSIHGALLGYRFTDIRQGMNDGIQKGLGAVYIFILIGMLVAAFIESGTVAWLIYYGLEYLSPTLFLPASLVLCTLMSLATGTAWGTVATAGVVLLEVGTTMGIPVPIIAGAVISGASCGDKMSPVSDTTNLSAMSAGAPMYEHIRVMLRTSIPAYLIALALFSMLGLGYADGSYSTDTIQSLQEGLAGTFSISFWALFPILTLIILSQRKFSPEVAMLASVTTAGLVAVLVQGASLQTFLNSLQSGYQAETSLESLNNLLSRGGIQSMMWTLSLSLIALALGGVLNHLGILQALLKGIISRVKRTTTLLSTTIVTGLFSNLCLGEAYLSIILGGQLYKDAYRKMGLRASMLSRSLEEGATLTTGLLPWTTAGLFYTATLDVSVFEFAPWALFNLITPLLSIALALFGIGVYTLPSSDRFEEKKAALQSS